MRDMGFCVGNQACTRDNHRGGIDSSKSDHYFRVLSAVIIEIKMFTLPFTLSDQLVVIQTVWVGILFSLL